MGAAANALAPARLGRLCGTATIGKHAARRHGGGESTHASCDDNKARGVACGATTAAAASATSASVATVTTQKATAATAAAITRRRGALPAAGVGARCGSGRRGPRWRCCQQQHREGRTSCQRRGLVPTNKAGAASGPGAVVGRVVRSWPGGVEETALRSILLQTQRHGVERHVPLSVCPR